MAELSLEQTEIRYQGRTVQVRFPKMAEDLGYLAPLVLRWVGNAISAAHGFQIIVTGEVEIGGTALCSRQRPVKAVVGPKLCWCILVA